MNPERVKCADCGHTHEGPRFGGICIGCPCPSITHEPAVAVDGESGTPEAGLHVLRASGEDIAAKFRALEQEATSLRARVAELEALKAKLSSMTEYATELQRLIEALSGGHPVPDGARAPMHRALAKCVEDERDTLKAKLAEAEATSTRTFDGFLALRAKLTEAETLLRRWRDLDNLRTGPSERQEFRQAVCTFLAGAPKAEQRERPQEEFATMETLVRWARAKGYGTTGVYHFLACGILTCRRCHGDGAGDCIAPGVTTSGEGAAEAAGPLTVGSTLPKDDATPFCGGCGLAADDPTGCHESSARAKALAALEAFRESILFGEDWNAAWFRSPDPKWKAIAAWELKRLMEEALAALRQTNTTTEVPHG